MSTYYIYSVSLCNTHWKKKIERKLFSPHIFCHGIRAESYDPCSLICHLWFHIFSINDGFRWQGSLWWQLVKLYHYGIDLPHDRRSNQSFISNTDPWGSNDCKQHLVGRSQLCPLVLVVEMYISVKDKPGYFNGDSSQPSQTYPTFRKRRTDNAIMKGWLIKSMDSSLISNFIRFLMAKCGTPLRQCSLTTVTPHRCMTSDEGWHI